MNSARIINFAFWLVLFVGTAYFSLFADTCDADKTVQIGDFVTSNWRSQDFSGSIFREWDASGKTFTMNWKIDKGDQMGRIGVGYGSKLLGASIHDMPSDSTMSTTAAYTPSTNTWFYWSIYGWTNGTYAYWGNTKDGWNNEFYIIFKTDRPTKDFLTDKGVVVIGSVDVDGVTFDCFKTPRKSQSQFVAVTRSKTWSASVNLKKIFA